MRDPRTEADLHERAARLLEATGARDLNQIAAWLDQQPGLLGEHRAEAVQLLADLGRFLTEESEA